MKKRSFPFENVKIVRRDEQGKIIYKDSGKPQEVMAKFVCKFSDSGVKINKNNKYKKKLLQL